MKLQISDVKTKLIRFTKAVHHYIIPLFLVFLVAIYGFLGWRAYTLNNTEPDQAAVSAKLKTSGVPRIDKDVVTKIKKLQDNSVAVQSLFDAARSNPFAK